MITATVPPPQKRRAINVPKSDVGEKRHMLYRFAIDRIHAAMDAEFYLEVITLCESLIGDRLESHLARLNGQNEESRRFRTLEGLLKQLREQKLSAAEKAILEKVADWKSKRNEALHQMAKLPEGKIDQETFEEKYAAAKIAAQEGYDLFDAVRKTFDCRPGNKKQP